MVSTMQTRPVLVEIKQAFHQIRSTYDSDHLAIRNHRQPLELGVGASGPPPLR